MVKKTITLTVVVDDDYPLRERVVRGAINGILPSINRVAESTSFTTEKTDERAEQ